jgi:hypothetical protein
MIKHFLLLGFLVYVDKYESEIWHEREVFIAINIYIYIYSYKKVDEDHGKTLNGTIHRSLFKLSPHQADVEMLFIR